MTESRKSEILDTAALALAGVQLYVRPDAEGAHVFGPDNWCAHSLEGLQSRPNRIKVAQTFSEVGSLVAYLKTYSFISNLLVVSSPKTGTISATLDYHDPSTPIEYAKARWSDHTAAFRARFTPEYAAWRDLHRKSINQTQAGEFLEDRLYDIAVPTGAEVMDMVMKFDALKKVSFSQSTRLRDGQTQFLYSEENEARGALTIPDSVTLLLPIYEGMEPERILVRLRFRIADQKLMFSFVIANIEQIERMAFRRCEDAFVTAMPGTTLLQT